MEAQATLEGLVPVERSDSSFFRDGIYDRLDNLQNMYHIFCIAIFFQPLYFIRLQRIFADKRDHSRPNPVFHATY